MRESDGLGLPQPLLVERDAEVAALDSVLVSARAGRGSVLLLEGPPGIGKTSLLALARRHGSEGGMRVLRGRGTELEREYPLGVVRQCLGPALRRESDRERLLHGAARLAGPAVLDVTEEIVTPPAGLLHGLYWLVANLADESPLLMLVDDAQRADERLAEVGFGSHRRTLPLLLAQARLLARAGDPALTKRAATIAAILDEMVPVPWMTVLAGVVVGECLLEVGELGAADAWSKRALGALRTEPDVGVLEGRAQRLRLGLKGRSQSEPISPAELRVLELLPTHLSVGQMAERLCVSTNTVKSHGKALYRKLGVANRAGAVRYALEHHLVSV